MKKHIWYTNGDEFGKSYSKTADKKEPGWSKKPYDFGAQSIGGHHNGPRCKSCGYGFCHHCYPEGYKSVCGSKSLGADDGKLDKGYLALEATIRAKFSGNKNK